LKSSSFSQMLEVCCVAMGLPESWNTGTPAISRYRYTIVTSFVELYPPAGNHKLKFQKESLIFHFRVPRGAEYRAKRRDFVSSYYLGISIFALVFFHESWKWRHCQRNTYIKIGNRYTQYFKVIRILHNQFLSTRIL